MRVYQSCGRLEIDETTGVKKINVKTFLPELRDGGTYKYTKYYNISTEDYYGILGVLVVRDEVNVDMTTYPDANNTSKLRVIDGNPIHLPYDLNPFGDNDFSKLTIEDTICFICFHDDNFDENNTDNTILKYCQELLPNCDTPIQFMKINKGMTPQNTNEKAEPMKGNGGILTADGCE